MSPIFCLVANISILEDGGLESLDKTSRPFSVSRLVLSFYSGMLLIKNFNLGMVINVEEQINQPGKKPIRILASLLILLIVFVGNNILALVFGKLTGIWDGFIFFVVVSFGQALFLVCGTLYLALMRWGMTFEHLGLGRQQLARGIKQGLSYGPLVFILVIFAGVVVELFYPIKPSDVQPFTEMVLNASSPLQLALLFLFGVIIAPFAEELYFRGLLFRVLKQNLGLVGGIVVSGIVFGLLHFDLSRFFPLMMGGIALAVLYHRSKSLYAPMIAHGVWNALMFLIILLAERV